MQGYKISFFDNVKDVVPKEKLLTFDEILSYFKIASRRPFTKKDNLEAMICGSFSKSQRDSTSLTYRSIVTYDIDNYNGNIEELLNLVKDCIKNNTYIYYTTTSSTEDKPRIRLMLFIEGNIEAAKYNSVTRNIAAEMFPKKLRDGIDSSSYSPMQLMFLPCMVNSGFRAGKNVGDLIDTGLYLEEKEEIKGEDDFDSLSKELVSYHKNLPLEIPREKIDETLTA